MSIQIHKNQIQQQKQHKTHFSLKPNTQQLVKIYLQSKPSIQKFLTFFPSVYTIKKQENLNSPATLRESYIVQVFGSKKKLFTPLCSTQSQLSTAIKHQRVCFCYWGSSNFFWSRVMVGLCLPSPVLMWAYDKDSCNAYHYILQRFCSVWFFLVSLVFFLVSLCSTGFKLLFERAFYTLQPPLLAMKVWPMS